MGSACFRRSFSVEWSTGFGVVSRGVTRTTWKSDSHIGIYMLSYGLDLKTSGYGLMFASHRDGEDGVSRDNDKLDC